MSHSCRSRQSTRSTAETMLASGRAKARTGQRTLKWASPRDQASPRSSPIGSWFGAGRKGPQGSSSSAVTGTAVDARGQSLDRVAQPPA